MDGIHKMSNHYYEPEDPIDEDEELDMLDDEDEHVDEDDWERDDDE